MAFNTEYDGVLKIVPDVPMRLARTINAFERGEPGAPDSHCEFEITEDGDGIEHSGAEKTRDDAEWIKFIIETALAPAGHVVNGVIEADCEGEIYEIIVQDNVVSVQDFEQRATTRRVI